MARSGAVPRTGSRHGHAGAGGVDDDEGWGDRVRLRPPARAIDDAAADRVRSVGGPRARGRRTVADVLRPGGAVARAARAGFCCRGGLTARGHQRPILCRPPRRSRSRRDGAPDVGGGCACCVMTPTFLLRRRAASRLWATLQLYLIDGHPASRRAVILLLVGVILDAAHK